MARFGKKQKKLAAAEMTVRINERGQLDKTKQKSRINFQNYFQDFPKKTKKSCRITSELGKQNKTKAIQNTAKPRQTHCKSKVEASATPGTQEI